MSPDSPSRHDLIVAELRIVRRSGLQKLRIKIENLPTLRDVAAGVYGGSSATELEQLLRDAWRQLGRGPHGVAIGTLFGLAQGRRGGNPSALRALAADQLGYATVETFRKRPETEALEDFATQVISIGAQWKVRTDESDDRVGAIVAEIEKLTSLELAELARQLSHRFGPLPDVRH